MVSIIHTRQPFKASQKGQVTVEANTEALLLSDTHWYWWYIKLTSTGEEGFIPAELLEMPSERQARINSRINARTSLGSFIPATSRVTKKQKHVRFTGIEPPIENQGLSIDDEAETSDASIDTLEDNKLPRPIGQTLKNSLEHLHIEHAEDTLNSNPLCVEAFVA